MIGVFSCGVFLIFEYIYYYYPFLSSENDDSPDFLFEFITILSLRDDDLNEWYDIDGLILLFIWFYSLVLTVYPPIGGFIKDTPVKALAGYLASFI